ncbi:MAG: hypothetical protein ACTSPQ_21900 [Candidatus Helarchaeota archaeon]
MDCKKEQNYHLELSEREYYLLFKILNFVSNFDWSMQIEEHEIEEYTSTANWFLNNLIDIKSFEKQFDLDKKTGHKWV